MGHAFDGADRVLRFVSGVMSESSRRLLLRRIERLTEDFEELADVDAEAVTEEEEPENSALLIAFRPWRFGPDKRCFARNGKVALRYTAQQH